MTKKTSFRKIVEDQQTKILNFLQNNNSFSDSQLEFLQAKHNPKGIIFRNFYQSYGKGNDQQSFEIIRLSNKHGVSKEHILEADISFRYNMDSCFHLAENMGISIRESGKYY